MPNAASTGAPVHKPLLSTYFVVRAYVEQPNGERRHMDEQVHKVCSREMITRDDYLEYVAWGLYIQYKRTANHVLRLTVINAEGPGGERFPLNRTVMPGDIDPDWRPHA